MPADPSPSFMPPRAGSRIRRYAAPASADAAAAIPARITLKVVAPAPAPPPLPDVVGPTTDVPRDWERELLAIVEASAPGGLTAALAFKLKEEALLFVMATLTVAEAKALYMRLATPLDTDRLAVAFQARLVGERRTRILAFLAGAPRRVALRSAR